MTALDGIISLNKPPGISSAKALYRVRSITGQRKSGHAGTLDPAASGVLLILLGRATKLTERIMDLPKVYRATARLDVTSASFDSDKPLKPVEISRVPSEADLQWLLASFEGVIEQAPPIFSALKVGGRPAYKLAAKGRAVKLAARAVRVYWIRLHAYRWPEVDFEACCGRGTYVRAMVRDLGDRLGTGGCLTSLTRTRVGPFGVEEATTLDELRRNGAGSYLWSLERAAAAIAEARDIVPA